MSIARNQRRLAEKTARKSNGLAQPISKSLGQSMGEMQAVAKRLPELIGLLEELKRYEHLPAFIDHLDQLRFAVAATIEEVGNTDYELRKQRAVNLRFLYNPPKLVSPGEPIGDELTDLEESYRSEFDGIMALVALVTVLGTKDAIQNP